MNQLLVISGPTATGKTALAIKLAKKYHGELISADSCQIYKGMDIGVGKDHPVGTPIHLIDLITPNQSFSAAQFRTLALAKIKELQANNILPILVGGSGFYIDAVLNPEYSTFKVPPNRFLRFLLNRLPLNLLKIFLKIIDSQTYIRLNNSDINNPRRLIRKIEIKLSSKKILKSPLPARRGGSKGDLEGLNFLHLSLTAPHEVLYSRIDDRVENRLRLGFLKEIKELLKTYSWKSPGLQISAYKSFLPYFESKIPLEDCVQKWKYLEHRDARHLKTWFARIPHKNTLDITDSDFEAKIEAIFTKWYNQS